MLNENNYRVDVCVSLLPMGERAGERGVGLCHLMRCFQHLHEKGVDGGVANELEKKQVLQTLEADGAKCW